MKYSVGTGGPIVPGFSDALKFTATAPTGNYPFGATFTTRVQDASNSTLYYLGPIFNVTVISPGPVPGKPTGFKIMKSFDLPYSQPIGRFAVGGWTAHLDIQLTNSSGMVVQNPGPTNIQVNLVASAGTLSSSTAYISSGKQDTSATFGDIAWILPVSVGQNVSIIAVGVLSGAGANTSTSVTIVSKTPVFTITSPTVLGTLVRSNTTTVVFTGNASVSAGYPPNVLIQTMSYRVDSGRWTSVTLAPARQVSWLVPITFDVGNHSVQFNATDSTGIGGGGNVFVSSPLVVSIAQLVGPPTPPGPPYLPYLLIGGGAGLATVLVASLYLPRPLPRPEVTLEAQIDVENVRVKNRKGDE